jgi:N-acyl-D-aspartate/D-glutamate deacylase
MNAFKGAKTLFRVAIVLIVCLQFGCGKSHGDNEAASQQVDELFAPLTVAMQPGAAVMVIRDGKILHTGHYGYADLDKAIPITAETNFRLASVSKQFAAMAIMLLEEDGRISYDDPISLYVPELAAYPGVTVRHLLQHTGGLPDYYDLIDASGDVPTNADAASFLGDMASPEFAPGERYEYSNSGYDMLGPIVEAAAGMPFVDFVRERIFEPLNMGNSLVHDHTFPEIPNRAIGYDSVADGFKPNDFDPLNGIVGSGGIYSNLQNMHRWDQSLYGEQLVSRESLATAFTPGVNNQGESVDYGFGWRIDSTRGHKRVSHGGSWVGFRTHIARIPELHFSIVILSNRSEFSPAEYIEPITDIYLGPETAVSSWLITNARIVDGTGAAAYTGALRVDEGLITQIGQLQPLQGETVVDAQGKVLAPGFIDTHSHADSDLFELPEAIPATSQGITTTVVGQDGGSVWPIADFFGRLERDRVAINVASYSGHGTLRDRVMGKDFRRQANANEVEAMAALLDQDMAAGALGLSTGIEYDPGIYSDPSEIVTLARVAAGHGGRYISHVRSEDRWFEDAVEEIINIGRQTGMPVQISHFKLAMKRLWGQAPRVLERLDQARAEGIDITADIYPYEYWHSNLMVLLPGRDPTDRKAAELALAEIAPPEGLWFTDFPPHPEYVGMKLTEVAALRGKDPVTTFMEVVAESTEWEDRTGEGDSIIGTSMLEDDIRQLLLWPHSNLCTDGGLVSLHPRARGSYPRVLGRYVREERILSLEEAVYKASGLAARHMGITDRGTLVPGSAADLVLFDPDTVIDRATPQEPEKLSSGVLGVWVNGEQVFADGRATGKRPGRVIKRASF